MFEDAATIVRAARRFGDLSQRQLAEKAQVSPSTVTRIESGRLQPTLAMLLDLLAATGCTLSVVRWDGKPLRKVKDGRLRDRQGRRYPPHLDVVLPAVWRFGTRPPPGVVRAVVRYQLDRTRRDHDRGRGRVDPRMLPSPWE